MNNNPNETCLTCRYYAHFETWGQCRINPPRTRRAFSEVESQLFADNALWPRVQPSDFCGEWKKSLAEKQPAVASHIKVITNPGPN